MYETYKLFSTIRVAKYSGLTNEQLALEYKKALAPEILAEMYCRNYPLWVRLSNQFPSLSNEDKVSIITEKLNIGMQKYTTSNTLFISYIYTVIKNQFIVEYRKTARQFDCISVDDNDNGISDIPYSEENYKFVEFEDAIQKLNIPQRAKEMCILLGKYSCTQQDLAKMLGVSRGTICMYLNKLKNILPKSVQEFVIS